MSQLRYTPQQEAALRARRGQVSVDAGAGCGKTFVLTERFLSHLDPAWADEEPPAGLDDLVAITFTDAAAREMRDRIRSKCRERLLESSGDEVAFWRRLLRSLDGARVSTIHSFAAGLIRDHAIELGIDPSFAVVDPAEAAVLQSAAVDDALRAQLAPDQGAASEELIATAAEYDLNGLRSRVRTLMGHAQDRAFRRWLKAQPDDQVEAWRRFYVERVAPLYAAEFLADPDVDQLRALLDEATPQKPEFVERVAALQTVIEKVAEADDPDAALRDLIPLLGYHIEGTKSPIYGDKDFPDKQLKKRFSEVRKNVLDKLSKQRRPGSRESMQRAAELGLQVLRIAASASRLYESAKRDRAMLDNDDLLIVAHRLLTSPAYSEARDRVSQRVRVLMVDEFQDTDPRQAELAQAIVGQATDAKSLFVVGDFKQSIYRFRGAEPEVFKRLRESTPDSGRLTLSVNFRSQPAVLDFVNTLFAPIFGDGYEPLNASRPQAAPRPGVEFLWTAPPEESDARGERHAEAATIAARIREMIDGAEPTVYDPQTDQARPARLGDFALLFRALSDVAPYEQALREAGLPYYLVGGHAFYAQQEVYDLLNLLRSLLSECDDIALAGVLRSPMFALTDEALFWLASRGGLNAGLFGAKPPSELSQSDRAAVDRARETLSRLRRDKDRMSAAELLRTAWDATAYDAALVAEFLGERKLANLEKLHEQARQADASGAGLRGLAARLTEFVNQPPKEALAATTAGDADVVRLMTVHGSKGLEFPVVVLPDLNRKTRADTEPAAYHPDLGPLVREESVRRSNSDPAPPVGLDFYRATERQADEAERDRLFYVACTRAADRLVLSSCWDADKKLEGPWIKRLAERFDLESGERLDGGASLVAVTPPPPPVEAQQESTSSKSLKDALEDYESGAAKPDSPPPEAEPVVVSPADLVTFSVSRLSGRLHRGAETYGAESFDASSGVDPRRLGTLVHAILERLDPADDDSRAAISHWATVLAPQHLRRSVADGTAEARRLARRFVEMPAWGAMRSATSLRREVDFLLPWSPPDSTAPPAMLQGYIDALYQDGQGGWCLVDYKTNAVDPAGVPALAEQYALQMAVYAHAVESAVGARPVSLTLAFLAPGVEHTFAWDDSAVAASSDAISEAIANARTQQIEAAR